MSALQRGIILSEQVLLANTQAFTHMLCGLNKRRRDVIETGYCHVSVWAQSSTLQLADCKAPFEQPPNQDGVLLFIFLTNEWFKTTNKL